MAKVKLIKPLTYRYKGLEFKKGVTVEVSAAVAEYLGAQRDQAGKPYFRTSGIKLKPAKPLSTTLVEPVKAPEGDALGNPVRTLAPTTPAPAPAPEPVVVADAAEPGEDDGFPKEGEEESLEDDSEPDDLQEHEEDETEEDGTTV